VLCGLLSEKKTFLSSPPALTKGQCGGVSPSGGEAGGPPTASGRLLVVGGCWELRSHRPTSFPASSFLRLVLLGLGLGLPSAAFGAEVEAGRAVMAGVAWVALMHPIGLASPSPVLHWADLGVGHALRCWSVVSSRSCLLRRSCCEVLLVPLLQI
jgi:hypothetical protein